MKKKLTIISLLGLLAASAEAATATYIGGTNGTNNFANLNQASLWKDGVVPATSVDVVLNGANIDSATDKIKDLIFGDFTINSLSVSGSPLRLSGVTELSSGGFAFNWGQVNKTLKITNDVSVTDGIFKFYARGWYTSGGVTYNANGLVSIGGNLTVGNSSHTDAKLWFGGYGDSSTASGG